MPNSLFTLQRQDGAGFIPYGPSGSDQAVPVADSFGQYEIEYAAIRKGVGLMAMPQRGLVEVTGGDRIDFLHRMLTNDVRRLQPGQGCHAFLLNKKGRIAAAPLVLHEAARTVLEVDVFQAPLLVAQLTEYLFTEDVQLQDVSGQWAHLALHGPEAAAFLAELAQQPPVDLEATGIQQIVLADQACQVFRRDETGVLGLHILVPDHAAVTVYQLLLDVTERCGRALVGQGRRTQIGWSAYNTARIEAGTPIFHIDFGPDSLPHETGVLDQYVSFTKGCYVGQEVVARLENLGHPKRVLVGLKCSDHRLPIAGADVLESSGALTATVGISGGHTQVADQVTSAAGGVIGAVTSSCVSPMLGGDAVALAVVKWAMRQAGTKVKVSAEGQMVPATVHALSFLK